MSTPSYQFLIDEVYNVIRRMKKIVWKTRELYSETPIKPKGS